jgi:hypothetical protein
MSKQEINQLRWIYARLVNKHGEDKNTDFMIRLSDIIEKYDSEDVKEVKYQSKIGMEIVRPTKIRIIIE